MRGFGANENRSNLCCIKLESDRAQARGSLGNGILQLRRGRAARHVLARHASIGCHVGPQAQPALRRLVHEWLQQAAQRWTGGCKE